jgi:peptide/nickel transport system substrate-binding protein
MVAQDRYWSRLPRAGRRGVLRGLALGAAGAVVVACGGGDDKSTSGRSGATSSSATGTAATSAAAAGSQPKRGGTLRYVWQGTSHLDVHQDSISGAQRIVSAVYDRLLWFQDKEQLPEPDLATAMPEQPDQTTFIFKIRDGVKFHDKPPVNGRTFTAQDAAFSLNRARTKDPLFVHAGDLVNIDAIEAVDNATLKITTKSPDAVILTTLAGYQFIMLAPETVERFGDLKTGDAAIGTGPFMVKSFSPDTGAELVRHPNYWVKDQPYLDGMKQLILSPADAWSQFLAGNIEEATVDPAQYEGFDSFDAFLKSTRVDAYTYRGVSAVSAQAHFMNSGDTMFKDQRLRQAMNLIVDRDPQIRYGWPIGGYYSIALSDGHKFFHLPADEIAKMPGFRKGKDKEKDVADALAMLQAAGYTRDNPAKWEIMGWSVPQRTIGIDQLQLVAEMYRKVSGGVLQPSVKGLEWGAWKQAEARYQFQMISSQYSMGNDPHDVLQKMYHSQGGRNFAQFKDPQFDAMLDKERGAFNIDERKKLIQEMLRYLNDPTRVANVWTGTGPGVGASVAKLQGRPELFDTGKTGRLYFAS